MSDPVNTFDADTVLVDMQNAVRDKIVDDNWYAGIDVFTPDDMADGKLQAVADIQQRVNQALSSIKAGVCLIVSGPVLTDFALDAPDLVVSEVALLVRIIEAPLVNRGQSGTRKTASTIAIHTLRRLWHFTYLGCTIVPRRASLMPSDIKAGTLVWDILYHTHLDLASLVNQPQESP